ncbi:MAG TPA: glycosyltransferase [Casimicrobiaceae bacterium]|nr:glycosyltransferase [Casimicrobiaceae bacterium]
MSARPRKVLYVITHLWVGGAEATLTRLVTAEPRIADEITVVALRPGGPHADRLRASGVTVVELNFGALLGIPAGLSRLARLIARTRPDIVQGWMYHGDIAALIGLALSGLRRSTRLAWAIRGSDIDFSRYSLQLCLVVKACALLSRLPDLITANSAAGLKTHLGYGYCPRRAEIVPNGIDMQRFRPDANLRAAVRRELGIPAEAIVVAHVARINPMKDHDGFLAAMAELPDLRALLIGTDTERLPDRPNLLRLGGRDDVERLLPAADLIVSSSAFGEGFSNALAEGMACGLPAVSTDVGDAALIVGDTGAVVPPRDPRALAAAIRALAGEDPAAHAERARRARARIVQEFSLERSLARWSGIYASLSARDARQ